MLRNTYENGDWKEYENLAGKNIKTFAFRGEKKLKLFIYYVIYIEKYSIQNHITFKKKKKYVFLARWRMFQFVEKISVLRYMNKIDFWCVKFLDWRKIDYKLKL